MTLDSSGDALPPNVRCHTCGARGSGVGTCRKCGTSFSTRHDPGTVLGSYRLHEVIGEGGMGIVYLATHVRLGRRVAIKMLRSHYTDNPHAVHRFFAEARAVNRIDHPNIVDITDFIEQPGGDNYYVMELLQGTSLAHTIERTGILPLERSIGIMMQVASVLEAVHRAGIVHRDVKPDNVFLAARPGRNDFVKLVDFGVAKLIDDNDDFVSIHNTNPGAILGTPEYMSPEQASATAVDHRTDIYAFGAVLYKLVTGRVPLEGANFGEIVVQLLTVAPTPPREVPDLPHEVPESLQELILSCLAKQTIDRPDSMETVSERLGEIADEQGWIVYELNLKSSGQVPALFGRASTQLPPLEPAPAPAPVPAPQAPPARRPRPWQLVLAAAGVVAVATLVFVLVRGGHDSGAAAKVQAELRIADERSTAGRLVTPGGDDALEHLLAARKLDPSNAGVRDRLHALAKTYEQLAEQAIAAQSFAEAAAHLQVVLSAEPDNEPAARRMKEIEAKMLSKQRGTPH